MRGPTQLGDVGRAASAGTDDDYPRLTQRPMST
jgi:hypothetical protein